MKIVLCDSNTINSYGFRTSVSGIDLERFKKNPVMLYNHDPEKVIGKWENVKAENDQLTAEPVFDKKDPFAAEIARKVEDGFIKGCSMGLMIKTITKSKGIDTATESLLLEASIVSIPADENALVLYADENREKTLSINEFNKLFYDMEKKEINIDELQTELTAKNDIIADLSAQISELKKALAEREYREAEGVVNAAIQEGKLPESVKSIALAFFLSNPEDTKKLLSVLNGKQTKEVQEPVAPAVSLSSMVKKDGAASTRSWDELDKAGELKRLKEINPEEFRRLFFEKFGSEYSDN